MDRVKLKTFAGVLNLEEGMVFIKFMILASKIMIRLADIKKNSRNRRKIQCRIIVKT